MNGEDQDEDDEDDEDEDEDDEDDEDEDEDEDEDDEDEDEDEDGEDEDEDQCLIFIFSHLLYSSKNPVISLDCGKQTLNQNPGNFSFNQRENMDISYIHHQEINQNLRKVLNCSQWIFRSSGED